jgi:ribosome-associated protein
VDFLACSAARCVGQRHPCRRQRSCAIARNPPATPRKPAVRKKTTATLSTAKATPGTPRKKAAAAGPGPKRAREAPAAAPSALDRLQSVIVASLEDDKAEGVVALDLAGKATFCDRMVIATGLADRQISAMATHLQEKLRAAGLKRVLVEGAGGSDWVLIDAGDIIVHLFKPEARAIYALEKMWGADLDEAV